MKKRHGWPAALLALSLVGLLAGAMALAEPTARTELSVWFDYSKPAYIIEASASRGGYITPDGPQTVMAGANFTFSFTASAGFRIADLTVDGQTVSLDANTTSYRFEHVIDDHTIHVAFAPLPTEPPPATSLPTYPPYSTPQPTQRPSGGGGGVRATAVPSPSPIVSPVASVSPIAQTMPPLPPMPEAPERDDVPPLYVVPRNFGMSEQ